MINGSVHLTLLMGPVVPFPAPRVVIDALQSVSMTSAAGSTSGFQMQFGFNSSSELNTLFLLAPALSDSVATPALRVMLVVTINGMPTPLFDGVMTNVQVQPSQAGGTGTINVTGEDLTKVMDKQNFDGLPYPAMPIAARVALICAKYAAYGIIPLPIPEIFLEVPIPVDKIPAHEGTDLEYIKSLAEKVGHVFYIEPGPVPGTNVAYFGPEIKVGIPQPALNIDMGPHTNVESLSFSFDPTKGSLPIVFIQNQLTRIPLPLPIPNLNPLQPQLGSISTSISNIKLLKDTAKMSPTKALSKGLAEAAKSQDSVTASGSLDVLKYGRVLKPRQLVGVRGAGVAYDGLYFVKSVTNTLKAGEFKQSFELSRNGLVSITPTVPV
jgi:hypothetical protein